MPIASRGAPNQPFLEYAAVSVMPATAVGRAKGRSTRLLMSCRPGNRYRTSTQARSRPKTTLMLAAANDVPKLSLYAARARGAVAIAQNWAGETDAAFNTKAANGTRTSKLR